MLCVICDLCFFKFFILFFDFVHLGFYIFFTPQYLIVLPCLFHLILCSVNAFPTLQCNFNSNYIFHVNFTFNSTYKLQKEMQKNIYYLGFIKELIV